MRLESSRLEIICSRVVRGPMRLDHPDELLAHLTRLLRPIATADPRVLAEFILVLLKNNNRDLEPHLTNALNEFLPKTNTLKFVKTILRSLQTKDYLNQSNNTEQQPTKKHTQPNPCSSTSSSPQDTDDDDEQDFKRRKKKHSSPSPEGTTHTSTNEKWKSSSSSYSHSARSDDRRQGRANREQSQEGRAGKRYERSTRPPLDARVAADDRDLTTQRMEMRQRELQEKLQRHMQKQMMQQTAMGQMHQQAAMVQGMQTRQIESQMHHPRDLRAEMENSVQEACDMPARRLAAPTEMVRDPELDRVLVNLQQHEDAKLDNAACTVQKTASAETRDLNDSSTMNVAGRASRKGEFERHLHGGIGGSAIFVSHVPTELCDVENLNCHFRKFGRIVNIKVLAGNRSAVIEFGARVDAVAALDSAEAPLGRPEVFVRWAHSRASTSRGRGGRRELNAGAGRGQAAGRGFASQYKKPQPGNSISKRLGEQDGHAIIKKTQVNQKSAMQSLDDHLRQQKELIAKLESAPKDERASLMKELKELQKNSKAVREANLIASRPLNAVDGDVISKVNQKSSVQSHSRQLSEQGGDTMCKVSNKSSGQSQVNKMQNDLDEHLRRQKELIAKLESAPKDERTTLINQLKELQKSSQAVLHSAKASKSIKP